MWYVCAYEYPVGEAKMTEVFFVNRQSSGFPRQSSDNNHWIHDAICFQNTSPIRLLTFDHVFVIKLVDCHVTEQPFIGNRMQCFTPTTTSDVRTIYSKVSKQIL